VTELLDYVDESEANGVKKELRAKHRPSRKKGAAPQESALANPHYQPPGKRMGLKTAAAFCNEYEPISYAVEPFIRSSSLYTLTAKTGAGKTALLIIMALAVATGEGKKLLGREVEKGRVAVIAAENPDGFRMRLMVAAFLYNIDLSSIANDLLIHDAHEKPEAIAAALKKATADGPFVLVIGDTLQSLYDGDDLNNNVQAGEFMRRLRPQTQIKGKPAVVVAAHPKKNATDDELVPYGAGAILNEIDGNLTLRKAPGGVTELHWQGKLRGVEFDPVRFRFELLTSPDVKDVKGREVQLPVLRTMTEADAEQRETAAIDRTIALLKAVRDQPGEPLSTLAKATGIPKPSVHSKLKNLAKPGGGKLVKQTLGKWTLTPAGREAIEAPK
jgi:hypothetical protein